MRSQQERGHHEQSTSPETMPNGAVNGVTSARGKGKRKSRQSNPTPTTPIPSRKVIMESKSTTVVILCVIIVLLLFLLVQLHVRNGQWGQHLAELQSQVDAQQTVLQELQVASWKTKHNHDNAHPEHHVEMWKDFAREISRSDLSSQDVASMIHNMVNAPAEEEDSENAKTVDRRKRKKRRVQRKRQRRQPGKRVPRKKKFSSGVKTGQKSAQDIDTDFEEDVVMSVYAGKQQQAYINAMNEGEMERRELAHKLEYDIELNVANLVEKMANLTSERTYLPVDITMKKIHQLMLRTRSVMLPVMENQTLKETTSSGYNEMDTEEKERIRKSLATRREELSLDKLFPLHVFDGHDKALIHWLDHIENGTMQCKNLTLLHFDSHPDMGPGTGINFEMLNNREELHPNVDIASFILPFIMKGCTHRVIWVRPKWCEQFADTTPGNPLVFKVGVQPDGKGGICTDSQEEYFETHYCEYPVNGSTVQYEVMSLADWTQFDGDEKQEILRHVLHLDEDPNPTVLLDIDEDYFSTLNPMGIIAGHVLKDFPEVADHMKILFEPRTFCAPTGSEEDISDTVSTLSAGIAKLFKFALQYRFESEDLETGTDIFLEDVEDLLTVWCDGREAAKEYFEMLFGFWYETEENQPGALSMTLVDALPHYLANNTEIEHMAHNVQDMLQIVHNNLAVSVPRVVTIAQSLKDDYTPPSHWPFIERQVMQLLSNVYNHNNSSSASSRSSSRHGNKSNPIST